VRIAIDIRRINEFGVGTYSRNIIRALAQLDHSNEYFLLGPSEKVTEMGKLPANFKAVQVAAGDGMWAELQCRTVIKRLRCDVAHIPHLFWFPRALPCPYVVTAHDLLDHMYRARSGSGLKRSLHFHFTRRVLKKAARIFAVSRFTKSEIEKLFGIKSGKIEVVYNAIDHRFLTGHATDADRQLLAERYQVNYPFVLYAGRISPHKNLVRIIEAFSAMKADLVKRDLVPDLKLIIIGDELSKHPDLRRTVIRGGVQNDVRFMGFVPIEVLRIFYDLAKVFIFPSLYEGFGLPPLEAMAHGTPVLTSNTSSIPEVVGNAAVMVNPDNVFEIMRAMERVLLDHALREKLRLRGYEQVKKFSWSDAAASVLACYRQVAGRAALPSAVTRPAVNS
jgi:glycosyltransferase involved in cell wall biosynthesis